MAYGGTVCSTREHEIVERGKLGVKMVDYVLDCLYVFSRETCTTCDGVVGIGSSQICSDAEKTVLYLMKQVDGSRLQTGYCKKHSDVGIELVD